ncbi:MAG: carboxypeptidase-like regulatory domain-containing protein [candidate division WOR-3 bacterium]
MKTKYEKDSVMHKIAFITIAGLVLAAAYGQPHAVTGRLELYGERGAGPAASVRVSLASDKDTIGPAVTGADGGFVITDVSPGSYILLVWADVQSQEQSVQVRLLPERRTKVMSQTKRIAEPQRYRVEVGNDPVTSLSPILINRFRFIKPPADTSVSAGAVVAAEGTHAFPANAPIWIMPLDANGMYSLQDLRLTLGSDGRWERSGIRLDKGTVALTAVLVSEEGDALLRQQLQAGGASSLLELPSGSRVIAKRSLTVGD